MRSKLPFVLMGLMGVAIAVATLIPESQLIYGSLWFKILWGAIAISGCYVICRRKLWHRPAIFALHVSFLVILLGALVTSLTSKRGMLHLRQGIPVCEYMHEDRTIDRLPFLIRLDTFSVQTYPGTEAPQDYISVITAEHQQQTISMNHIGRLHGYRFYQTSYDPDGQGTILTVNYDPWGTGITYLGYALFLLSFLFSLWKPKAKKTGVLLLFAMATGIPAHGSSLPVVPKDKAAVIERQQVMWNDRPCPVGTMAHDFLLKVYGSSSYHGLTATQVVCSWTLAPEQWNREPIIKKKGDGYRCLNDFIDYSHGTPKLKGMGDQATDEKVALILMLQQGTLVRSLPVGVQPLSDTHVTLELFYNRVPWTVLGVLACVLIVMLGLKYKRASRYLRYATFAFLVAHFFLRWYLCGHIPLANTYDTLQFIALCLVLLHPMGSAVTLFVSWLVERNPQITPLMPVLQSPWLSAHVSVVMLSYALLVASLFNRRYLRVAVSLLAVGIFLGAVWANVSWGAYWTWDPKESWALITLIVYSVPLHTESLPWFRSEKHYRIYSLLALACLLMTYLGVNYLLGGMHSYG